MRVNFKYGIKKRVGKLDHLVLMACNKGRITIARMFVYPVLVEQHHIFGDIQKNLAAIWANCSSDFQNDFREYTRQRITNCRAAQIPAYSNYAHFVGFLFSYQAENPGINLKTVTKAELILNGCPDNVADIVKEGFLPAIDNLSGLTNKW